MTRRQSEFTDKFFAPPVFAVVTQDDGTMLYCDRAGCNWFKLMPRHTSLDALNTIADQHWHKK